MGFWIFVGIAMAMVVADEILERKISGYVTKRTMLLKTLGAIPRVTR